MLSELSLAFSDVGLESFQQKLIATRSNCFNTEKVALELYPILQLYNLEQTLMAIWLSSVRQESAARGRENINRSRLIHIWPKNGNFSAGRGEKARKSTDPNN